MFVRRCELVLVAAAAGCVPAESHTLSRVTAGWAAQTAAFAEPSVTAALAAGALTAELCGAPIDWAAEFTPESELPLSAELRAALGDPQVDSYTPLDGETYEITASGVQILDRDDARLRLVLTPRNDAFTLAITATDAATSATFGTASLATSDVVVPEDTAEPAACSSEGAWVAGTTQWTDAGARTHAVVLPSAGDTSAGVRFACAHIPGGGTLTWSGQMDEEARTFTTADAATLDLGGEEGADGCASLAGVGEVTWPGTVSAGAQGGEWTANASVTLEVPAAE